jgi:xanthine dehydrogenase accessory factor
MSVNETQTESKLINNAISEILSGGATAALATLLELPETAKAKMRVGAKLLVKESGERVGGLGDSELDDAVIRYASTFLKTRDDAKTFRIADFAPELADLQSAMILFERIEAEPHLVIAGAGHVGASLARLAALLGYRVTLIDDREEFLRREVFASATEQGINLLVAESWSHSVREAVGNGRGVSVAIVTRGHKQDEDCLRAVVPGKPDYVGMIGSKRRTNIVLDKLRAEGADDDQLQKVHAPIGLDIGAVSPEEVALAILAEIVANRRGGSAEPLSDWRRR